MEKLKMAQGTITVGIRTWGNSAGMRLPVALLQQLGVKVGDTLSAKVTNGVLELR
ncbi:MAG: AbrB/MazE/SpoVT family DNA-binding domain-containing protein, partial [Neisseriaceae bacterium]|nr:AbrB/MazE/SpoVT family DNA-binding domain-containing protein [Neisseriaceae bacterium]